MNQNDSLHKLLARQLDRAELSPDVLPQDKKSWLELLNRIDSHYKESDKERYLLERSMTISSNEIQELNKKLENAQTIAKLGYLEINIDNGSMHWSTELRKIFELDIYNKTPSYNEFITTIAQEYKDLFQKKINRLRNEKNTLDIELKIKAYDNTDKWIFLTLSSSYNTDDKITKITGIALDITDRKHSDDILKKLNERLIISAREIGMADVAASILHNIGNVLNSVNVSSDLLVESLHQSHIQDFVNVCLLIEKNMTDSKKLCYYLTKDEQGKLIPDYLIQLSKSMKDNYDASCSEIKNINEKIQHIRDIVMAQQELTVVNSRYEKVKLEDIVKSTVMMLDANLTDKGIKLIEDYKKIPDIYVDRSKLVQIMVNLIQNAKESLLYQTDKNPNKQINKNIYRCYSKK